MENFIVSARKYRPTTFDSVVGQRTITATLKNAIKSNHLAQAFLFCGPRGVGKTTCARILAKTINCFNITQNIEACNECESCKAFDEGHSLNIHELDGASNNSVDDIRGLIDQVRFAPQVGTHKVYIIDEVHMLSQAAFNAFLKTLEEPPKHAIFILATTEKHKIIPTILSRCQIFDFNRIKVDDITEHLAKIAASENVPAEQDGLHLIAQKADGALRDALSMFDQIVSFSGGNVSYQDVIENLNILDYTYYFKVTDAIIHQQVGDALLLFNEILNKGFNGHNFVNGLAEHYRNLLVCQDEKTVELLEVGNTIKQQYLAQSKAIQISDLVKGLEYLNETDTKYKGSKNQRLLVEVLLMRLCSLNNQVAEKKKTIIDIPFKSNGNGTKPVVKKQEIATTATTTQTEQPSHSTKPAQQSIKEVSIQEKVTQDTSQLQPKETTKLAADAEQKEPITESEPLTQETNVQEKVTPETIQPQQNKATEVVDGTKKKESTTESEPLAQPEKESHETVSREPKTVSTPSAISFADSISIAKPTTEQENDTTIAEEATPENRPKEAFTIEAFQEKWTTYKNSLEKDGRSSLASVFDTIPQIEENTIKVMVENKVLMEEFQEHLSDFLSYIRQELNNYELSVETEINQDITQKKAYTPQEKFVKMAEKNPSLKVLAQKLDMDVGYA